MKILSEHEFDITAKDSETARGKALTLKLTKKNQVIPSKPKISITFD